MPDKFKYRPLLSQFSIKKGIGSPGPAQRVAPLVSHGSLVGSFFKRHRQKLGSVDVKRAPGQDTARASTSGGEFDTFSMVDRSIIKPVPFELVEGQAEAAVFGELQNAAEEAVNEIRHAHEKDVKNLIWADNASGFESKYTAARTLVPADKWDTATGKIRQNVQGVKRAIYKACGYKPNTGFITPELWDAISSDVDNELGKRIKYTDDLPQSLARVAAYLELQNVYVMDNLADPSSEEKPDSLEFMYSGANMLLAYINPANTRNKATFMSTFYYTHPIKPFFGTGTRYNWDNDSHETKVSAFYDVKTVDSSCAGVIVNALTS